MAEGSRPPPPTQAGAQVNTGKICCPLQPQKPCDVDRLVLSVIAFDDNWTDGPVMKDGQGNQTSGPGVRKKLTLKLETATHLRYRPAPTDPKGLKLSQTRRPGPDHPAALLKQYDLLIDTIADFPKSDTPSAAASAWQTSWLKSLKPDPMDLVEVSAIRAYYHSTATCSTQAHSSLKIHAPGAPELPKDIVLVKPGARVLDRTHFKLSAPSLPFHDLPTSGFPLFDVVKSLLSCTQPRKVEFVAQACGKRAPGDSKVAQPNHELSALLRIYRRDKWTIGVKIPPLGSYTDKRTAAHPGDIFGASTGDRERKQEWGIAGLVKRTTTDNVSGGNRSASNEKWLGNKGWTDESGNLGRDNYRAARYSDADGYVLDQHGRSELSNPLMRLKRSSGFKVLIAHNDRELDVVEFAKKIAEYIETIAKLVTDFQKLFKLVPKVGWTFGVSIAAFEGFIGVEWAPSYVDDGAPIWDGRYCAVEYKWKGLVELTVIDLKVSVGFGIEIDLAGLAELSATIKGSLTFMAKVAHDINMDLFKPKERFEIETSGGPALTAELNASVCGYTLIGGQVSVAGGLELKGCIEIEWATMTFDLKGTLKRKPVLLTGSIQYPTFYGGTTTRKLDPPIEIVSEGIIKVFQ